MEGTYAKTAQKNRHIKIDKFADRHSVSITTADCGDFLVPKIHITWGNKKTEILYPSDVRRKLKYLIDRVAGLKKKRPDSSKMYYDCTVLYHALNGDVTEKDLGIRGKKKKEVFDLLKYSSKPM